MKWNLSRSVWASIPEVFHQHHARIALFCAAGDISNQLYRPAQLETTTGMVRPTVRSSGDVCDDHALACHHVLKADGIDLRMIEEEVTRLLYNPLIWECVHAVAFQVYAARPKDVYSDVLMPILKKLHA